MRSYLIFGNKKCRNYAACGVSQTPNKVNEQRGELVMGFLSGFLSYLLLLIIFVVVGGAAIFLGITLRKGTNAKAEKTDGEV